MKRTTVTTLAALSLLLTGCRAGTSPGPAFGRTTPSAAPAASVKSYGPDGLIAYHSFDGLAVVRTDGSGRHLIGQAQHPDWSPDGRRLVYSVDEPDGTTDLWVARADGSQARRLVDCAAPCAYADDPAWSPDGRSIAYWTNDGPDDLTQPIEIVDARTGEATREIAMPGLVGPVHPRWSPNGSSLALEVGFYRATASGDITLDASRIVTVDLTAARLRFTAVTPRRLPAGYPDWSPDGTRLIFQAGNLDPFSKTGSASNLYTVSPNGSHLRALTTLQDADPWVALPDWGETSVLVTIIASPTDLRLGYVTADGSVHPLIDRDGGPVLGAHPRLNGGPCC